MSNPVVFVKPGRAQWCLLHRTATQRSSGRSLTVTSGSDPATPPRRLGGPTEATLCSLTALRQAPGSDRGPAVFPIRYARGVVVLLVLPVMVFVWIRRWLMVRREEARLAEQAVAEADAIRREREIIADMEARFYEQ